MHWIKSMGFWGDRRIFCVLCVFCLLVYGYVRIAHRLAWNLPKAWIKTPLLVQGKIISLPIHYSRFTRFIFLTDSINHRVLHQRLQLSWYTPPSPSLQAGERWALLVKIKPVHHLKNPQDSILSAWLQGVHYRANGYVLEHARFNHCLEPPGMGALVKRGRWRLAEMIHQHIASTQEGALLTALAIGMQNRIPDSAWQTLKRTGTSHLVAISGLHLVLVGAMAYGLLSFLWRFSSRLCLYCPATRAASWGALVCTTGYALLAGFGVPCQRAWIMLLCWIGIKELGVSWSQGWCLLFAAFIVYLWQPWSVITPGFWLSFSAVFWIGVALRRGSGRSSPLKRWFSVQGGLNLSLMPLSLAYFQGVSLSALLCNALAIPWISWVILPLILCFILLSPFFQSASLLFLKGSAWLLHPLWIALTKISQWPVVYWSHTLPGMLSPLGISILLYVLWMPVGNFLRAWMLVGILGLLFQAHSVPRKDELWMTLLDVDQGLSVVLMTTHHILVYDLGAYQEGVNRTEQVVLPFLRWQQIHQVDRLLISHADSDHKGDLLGFVRQMKVQNVFSSAPFQRLGVKAIPCWKVPDWVWDGVHFHLLYPTAHQPYRGNNSSCVLQIRSGDHAVLLTGDIESSAERDLLRLAGERLSADILQVPHHGSGTSSSQNFIQAVHPRYALISSGFYNRFDLPKLAVVERYAALGARIFNTAVDGAIQIRLNPSGLTVNKGI